MKWSNHYAKRQMTMKAQGQEGRAYQVISRGIPKPDRAYSVKHEDNGQPDRKTLIAVVPTISLAVMAAEQVERWERNGDTLHEDPAVARRARAATEALNAEPRPAYTFSVPVSEMITVQQNLEQCGLDIRLNCVTFFGGPSGQGATGLEENRPLPLPSLHQAIRAVNLDLEQRGVEPTLQRPRLMTPYSADEQETTELLLLMQTHYRWDSEQNLLENLWVKGDLEWSEIAEQYPTLFQSFSFPSSPSLSPSINS